MKQKQNPQETMKRSTLSHYWRLLDVFSRNVVILSGRGGMGGSGCSPDFLRSKLKASCSEAVVWGGGGSKIWNLWNKKKSKSTLVADKTKPKPVASAAPHPITPVKNIGVKMVEWGMRYCPITTTAYGRKLAQNAGIREGDLLQMLHS